MSISGTCNAELVREVNLLGASYTIDLRPYFKQLDEFAPTIKSLVIFLFGLSGVLIVLASAKE